MRKYLEACPQRTCMSCEDACPTVPSPLVGEGQGEGWRRCTENEGWLRLARRVGRRYEPQAALLPPLPVPPPHKGGGNAVAMLCPTVRSIRVHARRAVACPLSRGRSVER